MKNDQYIQALSELMSTTRNLILDQKRAGQVDVALSTVAPEASITVEKTKSSKTSLADLAAVQMQAQDCRLCSLYQHRTQVVFGSGRETVDLIVVTPPPSPEEDIKGQPLLGEAGQLFSNMLSAIGLSRGQVYITPVVKCRPASGETAQDEQVQACRGYLSKQVQMIQPAMVLALGEEAGRSVTSLHAATLDELRGKVHQFENIHTLVTYAPAYLVEHSEAKKDAWEDMKNLHAMICKKTGKHLSRKG